MNKPVIEALIAYLPYSDLIAMAGTCTTIRNAILCSQRWKDILTEWTRPLKPPHAIVVKFVIKSTVADDEAWYKINAKINNINAYARVIKQSADKFFTLRDVTVVTYSGHANNPKEVFM